MKNHWLLGMTLAIAVSHYTYASAESESGAADESQGALGEIIVTAQKRSQSINDVPLTVVAATGAELRDLGITDPTALVKLVPGLVYAKSAWGSPVYSLRGVGFYDNSLAAVPAVTIYVDEVPLPYSSLTSFSTLDVQRVEVLKGPQGTLYGESSTGGAINYVANKPTNKLEAGVDLSYGRFNDVTTDAFIGGPLMETLSARLAIHDESSEGWQHSVTRPGDTLGIKDIVMARLLLEWKPTSELDMSLNANFGRNRSESQAAQFLAINPSNAFARMIDFATNPRYAAYPSFNNNAQNADWDANRRFRMNNRQYQTALTVNFSPSDAWGLTSISSYTNYKPDNRLDADGTDLTALGIRDSGEIQSIYQELRVHGNSFDRLKWIVGANFEANHVLENEQANIIDSYLGAGFLGVGLNDGYSSLRTKTRAGYANADYEIVKGLTLTGAVRYTSTDFHYSTCTMPNDATTVNAFSLIAGQPIGLNQCLTATPAGPPGLYNPSNHENNLPWRVALEEKLNSDTLIYASVSKGYKSGTYPNIAASTYLQDTFVRQESLLDYEAGFKASLLDRTMQINGSVFYYDYKGKQVLGTIREPRLGTYFPALVNVPTSRILGGELEAIWMPVRGLTLDVVATYADSRITGSFDDLDFLGIRKEMSGERLPFAPLWSGVARADYKHPITSGVDGYAGVFYRFQSDSNSALGAEPIANISSYGTIDAQIGVEFEKFRVGVWGRNLTNKYYWNSVILPIDTVSRYAALPITYGVNMSYRY